MSEGMPHKMLGIMIALVIVSRTTALTGTTTPKTSDTIGNEVQDVQKTNEPNRIVLGMQTTHVNKGGVPTDNTWTTTGSPVTEIFNIEAHLNTVNHTSTVKVSTTGRSTVSFDFNPSESVSFEDTSEWIVTEQPRDPYTISVGISDGTHFGEFIEFTQASSALPPESNTREGQVGDFQPNSKDYTCCYDFECHSILGLKSHCAMTGYGTELICAYGPSFMPRRKRELDDRAETTIAQPGPTSTVEEFYEAGFCECNYGFVNINSSCKFDSDSFKCCYEMQCLKSLGPNSTCDHTSGGQEELCSIFLPNESPTFRGKCICKPGFELVNGKCVFPVVTASTASAFVNDVGDIQTSSFASLEELCNEQLCFRGGCGSYLRPGKLVCNRWIAGLKCYVAKQCVADDFINIFSCEDPCLNMTTSSPYSCYSEFCTTPLCNSNSSLVDDFQCSTAGDIYVSGYLWVLMLLFYANSIYL